MSVDQCWIGMYIKILEKGFLLLLIKLKRKPNCMSGQVITEPLKVHGQLPRKYMGANGSFSFPLLFSIFKKSLLSKKRSFFFSFKLPYFPVFWHHTIHKWFFCSWKSKHRRASRKKKKNNNNPSFIPGMPSLCNIMIKIW